MELNKISKASFFKYKNYRNLNNDLINKKKDMLTGNDNLLSVEKHERLTELKNNLF